MTTLRAVALVGLLFIAVLFTLVNTSRVMWDHEVSATNFIFQALGITGVILLLWVI